MNTPILSVVAVLSLLAPNAFGAAPDSQAWIESHRAFLQDGPGLLLDQEQRSELASLEGQEQWRWMEEFLSDPVPATELNELTEGIQRRRRLVREEFLTFLDDRARLLFLHGPAAERRHVDCDLAFRPLEIWRYGDEDGGRRLLLYQSAPNEPYRLWLPLDSKRVLYTEDLAYWLEQFEELRGRIRGRRFDYQLCRLAKEIDEITGVSGLFGFAADRPNNQELLSWLQPPPDLASWAKAAADTPVGDVPALLEVDDVTLLFPEIQGQRMLTRMTVMLPAAATLEPFGEEESTELRVNLEGVLELEDRVFEDFKVRFQVPAPTEPKPLALVVDRLLRPGQSFLVRFKLRDEVGGAEAFVARSFTVPDQPTPVAEAPVPDDAIVALGERLAVTRIPGRDSLVLVPPDTDVVLGLWRADALVTGEGIVKVTFFVDSEAQLTRTRPPFSAELRLSKYPTEQVVRAEGYGADGNLIAADEIVLNQQRGELQVRISEPVRAPSLAGEIEAAAEIVVPEERRVAKVEFLINDELQATRTKPPWRAKLRVTEPQTAEDVVYLTVVAELDDGSRAEDVHFLRSPTFLEQVDVDLVELYTTVTDRSGRPARGLEVDAFKVLEDGRPQAISKFELVNDLRLTLGIAIDTSGSMLESLGEAKRTAIDFLSSILTPRDRSFAVSFATSAQLLMPRTSDMTALEETLEDLRAAGATSLYDAVITSLYYFRGVRGRRALILLSDGEDTASSIAYRDTLEYARRSGVAIYSIGLDIGRLSIDVRSKLSQLAKETGGRHFFIKKAEELAHVYEEIEEELRSQYLLAYNSDRPASQDDGFRAVEVEVSGGKLKARTMRGYYP